MEISDQLRTTVVAAVSAALSAIAGLDWVTINGTHVLIGDDGTIQSGPPHLAGKKMTDTHLITKDFKLGDHVHIDRWNGGPQGGEITKIGTKNVYVRGPVPGRPGVTHDYQVPKSWVSHIVRGSNVHPVAH